MQRDEAVRAAVHGHDHAQLNLIHPPRAWGLLGHPAAIVHDQALTRR